MRVRNKLVPLAGVVAMASVVFTTTGAAAASPSPSAPAAKSHSAAARQCYAQAQESVKIRVAKKVGATALGLLPKGATAKAQCTLEQGERYSLCLNWAEPSSTAWSFVDYQGIRGYVPGACAIPQPR
ncbi:hypothetical protein [Streptomyces sp. NPDC001415]